MFQGHIRLHRRSGPLRLLILFVVMALAAGCGGGGGAEEVEAATTTSTTTTTAPTTTTTPPPPPAPPPTFPLTGLPANNPAVLNRPALVVKIDNADGSGSNVARPQTGLNQADVVYEEMVEGSVTRLAAVFHSADSDPVGPVRSARTTDIQVFTPLRNPLFAWSGANRDHAALIRQAAMVDIGYDLLGGQAYYRNERPSPHDLFSSTPLLYSFTPAGAVPPPPLFTFRPANAPFGAGARRVGSVHIVYGGGGGSAPVDYIWDPPHGGFARSQKGTPHVDTAGARVTPQNVIIQFANYVNTGYVDTSGAPVPEAQLVGEGSAWVLTNGHLIEARWVKPSVDAVTQYLDSNGAPVGLTPGRTWVALVPPGGATVTG